MASKENGSGDQRKQDGDLNGHETRVVRIWRLFFLTVLFVLFLLLLWQAVSVLLLLFAGTLVALALRFMGDTVSRWTRIPPIWALTLVLFVILGGGALGLVLTAPAMAEQFQELASNLQESVLNLERRLRETDTGSAMLDWIGGLGAGEGLPEMWEGVAGVFTTTFGALAAFFLTLTVGVFLAYSPSSYVRGFLRLIPIAKRRRANQMIEELADTLRWWMVGQLISMLILAVSTWLMLLILGVPLAFVLGLLTGALTFIPYLGPIIALIPILLVAFAESATLMITVLLLYLVIQNVEANVLMPIIFQQTIHLPPVLTIIAQLLLGTIFGFVGIILATPLMAAGINLVRMIYVEDILGDSLDKPLEGHE
jgi:predicted PurR-regulated permease PerM